MSIKQAIQRRLPGSALDWVLALASLPALAIVAATIIEALAPTLSVTNTIGQHDWDQMETHRALVVKSISVFHQFPFWEPYACGGHPNWGGFESGTTVISPWLPFYLKMTLPKAMRVEIWGSAIISAIGAWMLAGRFTRSPAAKALVVIAFAVNSRWALQITVGHTWHLSYAWTPWTLYFYDRAVGADPTSGTPRLRDFVGMGASIAMLIYTGGIYPLPETIFAVAVYGIALMAITRSTRPITTGLIGGLLGLGLGSLKLLPVLEVMFKHPRLVTSLETLDLSALIDVLTSHDQDTSSGHAGTNQWGWHEWGMYVGWALVALAAVGLLRARGPRESAMRWTGVVCFALGLGAFHKYAPWPLLHHLPVFQSQHVPSRWMYPGILALVVAGVAVAERELRRRPRLRPWIEVAALAAAFFIGRDVATVSRESISHMFATPMPKVADSEQPFHTEVHVPASLVYQNEWVPPTLEMVLSNEGSLECGTYPALHSYFRNRDGRTAGLGARGVGDPEYRGEAYVAEGKGRAELVRFTPNEMTVAVHGAEPGEHVVLNQNWDPGWTAGRSRTAEWHDQVSAPIDAPEQTFVFRYRPVSWWAAIATFVLTVSAVVWIAVRRRRERRAAIAVLPGNAGDAVPT